MELEDGDIRRRVLCNEINVVCLKVWKNLCISCLIDLEKYLGKVSDGFMKIK